MRGRPMKSDKEKKLKGTLQPCRVNKSAPVSKLSQEVKPSIALTGLAKKIWERTFKFLKDNDLMGNADIDLLTAYCREMSTYIEMSKKAFKIEKDNDQLIKKLKDMKLGPLDLIDAMSNLPRPDRWHRMAGNAFERALKVSDRFGFSPMMRQKLKLDQEKEPDDIMNKLLNPTWRSNVISAEA